MESEHMCISSLFLNDFIKVFLVDYFWLDENSGRLDSEHVGIYCIRMAKSGRMR